MVETIIAFNRLKEVIRSTFKSWGFLEVETPILIPYCNPDDNVENVKATFKDFQGKEHEWFLQTSPEFFMKRLVWKGLKRIFQVCKVFRSSEITPLHNIEFTMVEWYRVGENYLKGMEETEEIVKRAAEFFGIDKVEYGGKRVSLKRFERIKVKEAFLELAKVDPFKKGEVMEKSGEEDYKSGFFKLLVSEVEPALRELPFPVFLYDYPKEFSAMSKVKGEVAERFELYMAGVEVANGYTELTSYEDYLNKFKEKGKCAVDEGFLKLLKEKPLPECEGVALGFERLLMLLLGRESIKEVITFPSEELLNLPSF
ncbi:amino acid--tRNA ligase-related protein [Thermovibrio sp.]